MAFLVHVYNLPTHYDSWNHHFQWKPLLYSQGIFFILLIGLVCAVVMLLCEKGFAENKQEVKEPKT